MSKLPQPNLRPLRDSYLTLPHSADDIRWYHVVDSVGRELGKIDELLVDDGTHEVRFVRIISGGILGMGTHKVIVSVDAIDAIDHETEVVRLTPDHSAKRYHPKAADDSELAGIFDYFGY
jgi:sporulation protein YlmC with PRC-barrel domain